MNGVKIAQVYRKSDKVMIERKEENVWWITDTYTAFKLN